MSLTSKYYQVTPQVIVEYRTDQYKIQQTNIISTAEDAYMYQGLDGNQYCMLAKNIKYTKYPDETDSTYYYAGKGDVELTMNGALPTAAVNGIFYVNDNEVGNIIATCDESDQPEQTRSIKRQVRVAHDVIRLYLATGYIMNNIAGYAIRIKAKVEKVCDKEENWKFIDNSYIYLLDWYMPKEEMKDRIQWLAQPLYFSSAFYDRYIEIEFPSPYDLGKSSHPFEDPASQSRPQRNIDYAYFDDETMEIPMRGIVNSYADFFIEFNTVSPTGIIDIAENYACHIDLDSTKSIAIKSDSNAKFFNVRIEEDQETHSILYYPVYGDNANAHDLDLTTMRGIESGVIPMLDLANYDYANQGMDDFIETYGTDVFKWIIINELNITYNYKQIITQDSQEVLDRSFSEYHTNTIDYTGKNDTNGEFWRNKFVPYIKSYQGYYCDNISVQYTCHLYNRMNNIDIIKVASMLISNPYSYTLSQISTSNIQQVKVVNKINKINNISVNSNQNSSQQIVRNYFNATNIIIKDANNNVYVDGQMTLKLKHTNTSYLLRLYTVNNDNTRVPYDISGLHQYKLVFPGLKSMITVFPNKDSASYDLTRGSLIFYITSDVAKQIMEVPASERYFAIMTYIEDYANEETTIYEGKVDWI